MSFNFVEWTENNNRLAIILTLIVVLWGTLSYINLSKAEDPGFIIRTAIVNTKFPGASAQRVEELVTSPLEEAIMEMPELDNVQSFSREGLSYITVNFKASYTNMRPIFDSLRRKIESAQSQLPDGVIGPEVDDEVGDVFGSLYTLTGEGYNLKELEDIADDLRDQLIGLDLVSKVELHGVQNEVIYLQYSDARLREMGISPSMITNAITSANVISSGGDIVVGEERISLEPSGNFVQVEDLKQTTIRDNKGGLIQLQDIVQISRVLEDPPSGMVFSNNKPAIVIAIAMNEGGDILELGRQLRSLANEARATLPLGVDLLESAFQADIVELKINDFISSISQAVAIVFIVLVMFLGLRVAFAVALLIPLAIFGTFGLMSVFDLSINQVSLAGLIIALGLLVDNGIVVNESIMVKMQQGKAGMAVARLTTDELKAPLLVASLTTIAAFLPIALAESQVGEFCAAICYIVAMALGVSWLFSMTVIPALSALILKDLKQQEIKPGWLQLFYGRLVRLVLRFKWFVTIFILALFVTIPFALSSVPMVFIPPSDEAIISVELDLPLGRDIQATRLLSDQLEMAYREIEQEQGLITGWANFVGTSAPKFKLGYTSGAGNTSHISSVVNVRDAAALDPTIKLLRKYVAENHPDAEYKIDRLSQGPPVSYPIQVRLSGKSISELEARVADIKTRLRSTEGVLEIIDDWGARTKKINIEVNQDRALAAGVSSQDIATSLRQSLSGYTISDFREGEDLIPIVLIATGKERYDIRRLNDLTITSQSGASVSLAQVADVNVQWVTPNILRRDRIRTVTISATLFPSYTATNINQSFVPWLTEFEANLPFGYSIETGGESESSDEANQSIADKLPIAGLLIVLLLVGQFNSSRRAIIVVMMIPIGAIGMSWGLWIANSTFGFFTILGVISLAGIIINNAIVLLDSIKTHEVQGLSASDAVIAACESRMRPIFLTTLTTCGGMIPLWLGGGMFETMAVTIFFGLLIGSVITLVFVPALYAILFNLKKETVV